MNAERAPASKFSIDEYQSQVVANRREDHNGNWREVYPELLTGESLEFIGQHGVALSRIMPKEFDEVIDHAAVAERDANLTPGMIEEMGDILWFATSASSYEGVNLKEACEETLRGYGVENAIINEMADLDMAVMQNASKINVLDEMGISFPELDDEDRFVSVQDDPFYLFLRSGRRLIRSIQQAKEDVSPSTYIKEPVLELPQAVGEFVCVLTYIANDRLGTSIGEITRRNIEKLQQRSIPAT